MYVFGYFDTLANKRMLFCHMQAANENFYTKCLKNGEKYDVGLD